VEQQNATINGITVGTKKLTGSKNSTLAKTVAIQKTILQ
jgi:hypothetical protein